MKPLQNRFLALDVFRGLTVCFMIIVNTAGDKTMRFAPLMHADWHGFTPTDLVFPSFLFAVGNAMAFVMPKLHKLTPLDFVLKVGKRSVIIFLLGFLMYWFPFMKWDETGQLVGKSISETRILGVLQRIALAYFAASLLVYFIQNKIQQPRRMSAILMLSIGILGVYWLLLMLLGDPTDPLSIQGNIVVHADHFLFGDRHLYTMQGLPFDPEGLLSTLPVIVNVLAGYLAGQFIIEKGKTYEGLAKLLLIGFGLVLLSEAWNWILPINKKLWTSSFVTYTIGLDCFIIAAIIYMIDFKNIKTGTSFFTVFGKNALFIYLLSELLAISLKFSRITYDKTYFQWTYQTFFQPIGGKMGSLIFAIVFMLVCWLVGFIMDKKGVYIKV